MDVPVFLPKKQGKDAEEGLPCSCSGAQRNAPAEKPRYPGEMKER